jgi:hypothetical protein
MGREVVRAIIALLERRDEVPPRTVVPSSIVLRESVAAPRSK